MYPRVLLDRIVATLESITGVERIWNGGLVHRGGPHYRLRGTIGPVSIAEDECLLLGTIIDRFRPVRCFMIGNGFGLSGAFVAKMVESHGGESVVTLDNKSEGDGERCFKTAEQLRSRMHCRTLQNRVGVSPRDLHEIGRAGGFDLIFIDGGHAHPQVTADFHGVEPLLRNGGILCWHDYWLAGVPPSVTEAERSGFRCLKVASSCEMVFGTRDETVFREIGLLFQNSEAPRPRKRPLARLRLSFSFASGTLRARFARRPSAN